MQIFFLDLAGKTITLLVLSTDTIGSIKLKIYEKEKTDNPENPKNAEKFRPSQQRLIFAGKELLEDTLTLDDYNIKREDTVECCDKSIPIFVNNLQGKTVNVQVDGEGVTIKQLKGQIFEKCLVPVEYQRLIYAGKQLEDDKTMKDYRISRDATVHLVLRLPGGRVLPKAFH